jgi:glycosyltransferase involved in cell wall biosynthesis
VQHHFPGFGGNWFSAAWKLNRYAKSLKPDVVLVQGMLFPLQVILLKIQLRSGAKIIVQNHAEGPGRRHRRFFQQLADPFIDAYLFTAKEMGEDWVRKYIIRRPGKIREVMEASSVFQQMDRDEARKKKGIKDNPVFLWVGRLDQNKDPLTVLRAFLKFRSSQPASPLYMIFHTSELLAEIEELLDQTPGGRESVTLIGEQPHEEMNNWYNAADFILSGSHYEGSGIAVCEAMSCGCIPVLTNILSFRMMTADGSCGVLYEAGDERSLLSALKHTSQMNLEKEREKVLRQFQTALSFEAIAHQIGEIAVSL